MKRIRVVEWSWDDENLSHMARHGLGRRIVEQVAVTRPRFRVNKKRRAATHQMIGPDSRGRLWVACMVETPKGSGIWRVITGWPAYGPEHAWYQRQ